MRVIILHFLDIQSKHNNAIVKALSDGAAGSGHLVDVVDGNRSTDTLRLTPYEYVVILSPSYGLFKGKIPARVTEVLSSCGNLTGKKGAAFVTKALFSAPSANQVLMKAMEKEGMVVNDFNIIGDFEQACVVGSRLG